MTSICPDCTGRMFGATATEWSSASFGVNSSSRSRDRQRIQSRPMGQTPRLSARTGAAASLPSLRMISGPETPSGQSRRNSTSLVA